MSALPPQHVVLEGLSFATYERLLYEIGDRPIKLTYDRGTLEIMSPSQEHDRRKTVIGRMIELMTLELDVPIYSAGSTTWRRRDLEKGLEPDECYWVQNEPLVWNKTIDLASDPPPDLVVEVDVHSSCMDRMSIYAALGVPEVWRHDGAQLEVYLLDGEGDYVACEESSCFPWLPFTEFATWLERLCGQRETAGFRAFGAWVRDNLAVP